MLEIVNTCTFDTTPVNVVVLDAPLIVPPARTLPQLATLQLMENRRKALIANFIGASDYFICELTPLRLPATSVCDLLQSIPTLKNLQICNMRDFTSALVKKLVPLQMR